MTLHHGGNEMESWRKELYSGYFSQKKNNDELYHFGIKGQKWGVRRFQFLDGKLTDAGKKRYYKFGDSIKKHIPVPPTETSLHADPDGSYHWDNWYDDEQREIDKSQERIDAVKRYYQDRIGNIMREANRGNIAVSEIGNMVKEAPGAATRIIKESGNILVNSISQHFKNKDAERNPFGEDAFVYEGREGVFRRREFDEKDAAGNENNKKLIGGTMFTVETPTSASDKSQLSSLEDPSFNNDVHLDTYVQVKRDDNSGYDYYRKGDDGEYYYQFSSDKNWNYNQHYKYR